jgi:hypothetical protein
MEEATIVCLWEQNGCTEECSRANRDWSEKEQETKRQKLHRQRKEEKNGDCDGQ